MSIIIAITLVIGSIILTKRGLDKEKVSSYECGFVPFKQNHSIENTIYIRYFIIGIIFLIFDLETILIYPYALTILNNNINITISYTVFIFFILAVVIGLIYEFYYEILD